MNSNEITIKDNTANPGPLGLVAFGITTILLNLHNAGLFGLDAMILSMGIFVGGMLQIFVGMLEWKKGNMFGTIAFSSYGAFWLSFAFLIILPKLGLGAAPTPTAMGYYLAIWGVFTFFLFIATLKMGKAMQILFFSALLLFVLLSVADFTESKSLKTFAGIEGVFCGGTSLYIAMAELLNHVYGKKVLPLG